MLSTIPATHLLKLVTSTSLGVAAHLLVFIHGEWHLRAPVVLYWHVATVVFYFHAEVFFNSTTLFGAAVITACYFVGLFSSISIYRLFFHRLRHFPGPRLAAVSKLFHVWQCRDSRNYQVLENWHQKYGTFVRTGPAEITIFHASAFQAMDGPKSNTTRSDWYDLLYPRVSSVFTRDKELHNERRKIWSHSLSTKALVKYEARVLRKVRGLYQRVTESKRKPILINDLMRWFSFDLMGDFAFSQDFGMMDRGEYHEAIKMLRRAITLLGPFSPAIWIPRLGFALIPGFWKVKDWFGMLKFCDTCMERRWKVGVLFVLW